MADTLKNLQYMTINKGMKHIIGGDKMSHFPDMRIQDDSTLYVKLLGKKRSTFDLSKFTIVGSPTITDDGVVSGFSNGNYLSTSYVLNQNYKTFSIKFKFNTGSTKAGPYIIGDKINTANFLLAWSGNTTLALWLSTNDNRDIANGLKGKTILQFNKDYWINFTFDGTKYVLYISTDGKTYTPEITITSSLIANIWQLYMGYVWGVSTNYIYDLSHFSITVDGKEVFSGNKTGIDTIKANNYEVVGSPVISDDGVASGFTANNYLTIPSVDLSKPFKFSGTFTTGADIYHSQAVFGGTFESMQFFILGVHVDGYPIIYYPRTAGDSWIKLSRIVSANTTYHYTLTFDGTNLIFNLTDGASYNLTRTPTNFDASKLGVIPTLYIGRNASEVYIMQPDATIDLNSFKIYVDGNLVYQPCLKIPYTLSKTGSKIVDVAYRDRVQDMYEQFGYTHYYTLGDEPEKYNVQVVGSPTLVGGVASGFSNSNYLTTPLSIIPTSNIVIKTKSIYSTIGNTSEYPQSKCIWMLDWDSFRINSSNGKTIDIVSTVFGTDRLDVGTLKDGDIIETEVVLTTSKLVLNVTVNGQFYTFSKNVTTTFGEIGTLYIGKTKTGNYYWTGSIDLSHFSITVDGKEVFRGYEPVITDAFTLATNKGTDIIESYSDGEGTYYEVRADLVQRCVGIIPINTTEVNYPREFRDEKNIVQVAYFNVGESTATPTIAHIAPKVQTKSGFTIGAATNLSRNYYAEGKTVLG